MSRGINENYRPSKKRAAANGSYLNSPNGVRTNQERQVAGGLGATAQTYDLEQMIAHIRCNSNAAMHVHQHLTHAPYAERLNDAFEASTPQTPKRNLETSDNEGAHTAKQQRIFSNGKEKNAGNSRIMTEPTLTHDMPRRITAQQQNRLPFEQLKRAVSSNLPCFLIEY